MYLNKTQALNKCMHLPKIPPRKHNPYMATSLSLENNFMHAVPYSNMAYLSSHGLLMENKTHNITQNTNHKYITSFYFKIMIQLLFATEKKQKYQPLVDILEDDDGWYILGTILKASIQETST